VTRKLAAIMALDVVGYTRLMEADEAGTLAALKAHRSEFGDAVIACHGGRIVKLMGDGMLAEFPSIVDAVACAIAMQAGMADRNIDVPEDRQIVLRIGVNMGDVIVDGDDIYGDGVNIAARLEALADPGTIVISADAYRQVRGKVEATFNDLGSYELKNLSEPMRVYRVVASAAPSVQQEPPPLPDRPSIAVLPFANMSGDPDQEYFADGMVEDIITALSRIPLLFVIARNSSFVYKGRTINVKTVGRELGVRYVLEGSVRKAGNRVRITGQLIDATTGAHLWADRFDGALEDVFDLQDLVTARVVGAIAPRLEQAEIERSKRKPTESLDAYDYYLRGTAAVHLWSRDSNEDALVMFRRAIELDQGFAAAYGMAARCYSQRKVSGWVVDRANELAETERLARRAAALGKDDAIALYTAGIALAYVVGDLDEGAALIDQAIALNRNLAMVWLYSGWVRVWRGEPEAAIEHVSYAMRLSPQDPLMFNMRAAIACAHFFAGRYEEALSSARMAMREHADMLLGTAAVSASAAILGRMDEAHLAMARLRELDPDLRLSNLKDFIPLRREADFSAWSGALRKAGLPE